MELTWISLDKIKPNDYNPNVMSNDKFVSEIRVTAVIDNVTVEELAAMMQFLREYRERKKQ
jgi:hypothetical protein